MRMRILDLEWFKKIKLPRIIQVLETLGYKPVSQENPLEYPLTALENFQGYILRNPSEAKTSVVFVPTKEEFTDNFFRYAEIATRVQEDLNIPEIVFVGMCLMGPKDTSYGFTLPTADIIVRPMLP